MTKEKVTKPRTTTAKKTTTKSVKTAAPKKNNIQSITKIAVDVDVDAIRQRAYELFELRGRVDGFQEQDWYTAEQEILAGSNRPTLVRSQVRSKKSA